VSTQDIYNFRRVNDQLITGGQPDEEQIKSAADEGVTTIINLATINRQSSLPDEAGLVQSLGMTYYHIPVDWGNPTESDFDTFEKIFKRVSGEKTLVHCAANFRVTALYSLYAMKHLGWSEAQADEYRASIWKGSDHPVWEKFIAAMKTKIKR
jgi:uncharacterized protein (TIGR01244 family)